MSALSRRIHGTLPPLLTFVLVTALGEALVRSGVVASFLLPAPSTVLLTLWRDRAEMAAAMGETALAATLGLLLSAIVGGSSAILLAVSPSARRALLPYAIFFQTVPVVSIAPLLVVWLGFGLPTTVASAFLVAVFPVIANTLLGLISIDPGLADLFRLYDATLRQRLLLLRLPAAMPQIFAGLRVAAGLAVIGTIVGEFVAGGGLGGIVDAARTQQRVDKVFAAILLSSAIGLGIVGALNAVSHRVLRRWHPSESDA